MWLRAQKRDRTAVNRGLPVADAAEWRRIALEQQLPTPRFPAGVGAHARVVLGALVLVALLCVGLFAAHSGDQVPQAVIDSQEDLVTRVARTVSMGVDNGVDQLAESAQGYKPGPDQDLAKLLPAVSVDESEQLWSGAAVVDAVTRKALVTKGVPVALPETTDLRQRSVTGLLIAGQPQVQVTLPLPGDRALVASMILRVRTLRLNPDARHGVLIGSAAAVPVLVQGVAPTAPESQAFAREAVTAAAAGRTVSGSHPLPGNATHLLVVAATPIGRTGLAVTSVVEAPMQLGGWVWAGLPAALVLIVVALIGWGITHLFLVRPLHRLRAQAKAEACGDRAPRDRPRGPSEVTRISAAMGAPHLRRHWSLRRRVPAAVGLAGVFLLVLSWSGGMIVWYGSDYVATPVQIVRDEENRVDTVAHVLGSSLDLGLLQVSRLVADHPSLKPGDVLPGLKGLIDRDNRFRGAYLLDGSGKVTASAGRKMLRSATPLFGDTGIQLQAISGRVPVVFAYKVGKSGAGVLAEFDVDYLTNILHQVDGHIRVVDSGLRTILDTEGHLAFGSLPGAEYRTAAARALAGFTESRTVTAGWPRAASRHLVTGAGVVEPTTVTHLEWVVLADRSVSDLSLPAAMRFRAAVLVAGVAAALALFGLGWQWFVLVRPLRELAAEADEVAARKREDPISLRRHDEIGAIAACLEICRQVDMYGAARFGGAIRLRGATNDMTAILPHVPAPRDRRSSHAGRR